VNVGDRYGRYQIGRLLGRGAMGDVFLAIDTETSREVALKLVYKGPDPEDQEIVDAERIGAELQKRLAGVDRRVTAVNRYGEISSDLFIEMEYVDGEDLSTIVARGPVPTMLAVYAAVELCDMLDNLRKFTTTIAGKQLEGVIHGDLKPRNIRISRQNQVKVLDFGIAKALSQTRKYTMNVFASTAYCSPERLETQNMDSHSDLWSVGVLLYQMIAGRLPFDETTKERMERRIRSSQPPDSLPPACPEPLSRIIFKMLARDPSRRYQTATEMREDLQRFQRSEPVQAVAFDSDTTVRTSAPVRGRPTVDDKTTRTPFAQLARQQYNRNNVAVGCLAAVGVATVLSLGFGLFQMNFWKSADRLKTDLQAERVTNLDEAWNRYQTLDSRIHLPGLLWGARNALKKKLLAGADATIQEYRDNEAPQVFEAQWTKARNQVARAFELDSEDNTVKGRLRLCEGHLERINATGLKGNVRQKKLNTALAKFQESADLLKRWPDPYLGLARLYVYDLNDVEKAEEALNKAVDYGHPIGKRERAQLADGYRRRADRTWRDSRALVEIPDQERGYLDKARQDYQHAQDLYQQVGLYGDAARNEIQAMLGQQKVEQRLNELQGALRSQ
jgi:serine/threonine protein kinase